jgi:hypothetical protein
MVPSAPYSRIVPLALNQHIHTSALHQPSLNHKLTHNTHSSLITPAGAIGALFSYCSINPRSTHSLTTPIHSLSNITSGGAIGALFSYCQMQTMWFRRTYVRKAKWSIFLEIFMVSLLISIIRYWVPMVYGNCVDDTVYRETQAHHSLIPGSANFAQFNCGVGQVNDLAVIFWYVINLYEVK